MFKDCDSRLKIIKSEIFTSNTTLSNPGSEDLLITGILFSIIYQTDGIPILYVN